MQSEVEKLEHRIYGNGQPGDIGLLWQALKDQNDAMDKRVRLLEDFRLKLVAAVGGIVAIVQFLMGDGPISLNRLWR